VIPERQRAHLLWFAPDTPAASRLHRGRAPHNAAPITGTPKRRSGRDRHARPRSGGPAAGLQPSPTTAIRCTTTSARQRPGRQGKQARPHRRLLYEGPRLEHPPGGTQFPDQPICPNRCPYAAALLTMWMPRSCPWKDIERGIHALRLMRDGAG